MKQQSFDEYRIQQAQHAVRIAPYGRKRAAQRKLYELVHKMLDEEYPAERKRKAA